MNDPILISVLSLVLLLFLWLLFGPVVIQADTENSNYRASLPGVFSVRIISVEGLFNLRFRIFFFPFTIDPFRAGKKEKKEKKTERKRKNRNRKIDARKLLKKSGRVLKVKKLKMDVDTDDVVLNAWLIPAFSVVNNQNIHLQANFEGRMYFLMDLRTRIGSLLWLMATTRKK